MRSKALRTVGGAWDVGRNTEVVGVGSQCQGESFLGDSWGEPLEKAALPIPGQTVLSPSLTLTISKAWSSL